MNVILCGFMGSGKTTVGKLLAEQLGMNFVDTDEMIEEEQGKTIAEIFGESGEEHFRELEHEKCVEISKMDGFVVATGGGALTFDRNAKALKNNGVVFYLEVPFEEVVQRIGDSKTRPLFDDKEKGLALYNERIEKYKANCNYVADGNGTPLKVSYTLFEMLCP